MPSRAPGTGVLAAVAATAAVPAGYAWLRWNYPLFWKDVEFIVKFGRLQSEFQRSYKAGETIVDLFEKNAYAKPDHPCVLYQKEEFTYGEIRENACRVSRWVTAADPNLKKGDIVCLLLQNTPFFIWTWLGFLKKGIITSLLNFNLKPSALLHCIKVSEAKKLVFGSEFLSVVQELLPELRSLNIELWMVNDSQLCGIAPPVEVVDINISSLSGEPYPNEPVKLEQIAAYIFTSGTTGLPKPAAIPHRNILRGVLLHFFSGLTSDDVYYAALPLYHSAGFVLCLCAILKIGGTLALAKKFSAAHFWDDVRRYNVTGFQYIGELCRYLLAQPKRMDDGKYPQKLKIALGNGLSPEIWKEFQTRFNIEKIIEIYAATEGNFGFINFDGKVGSIGRYPWIMHKLLGNMLLVEYDFATGKPKRGRNGFCIPVPDGQTGLALFKVDTMNPFIGYKGPREKTEKKLIRNVRTKGDVYFNSGDLMKMDKENYIYFMDRIGDTFRWKGENVSTLEVSQVLSSFPAIMEANVYGVHVPGNDGRAGMAAIVLNKGTVLDLGDLHSYITSSLPSYACPKFIRVMDQMEVTGTFKHKKTSLVKEGFDVNAMRDDVYIMDSSQGAYVPLTSTHMNAIMSGQSKL